MASNAESAHGASHPTASTYVVIAAILAVVTAIEVAVYYIDALSSILVPVLLVLSAGKFVMVVGYFMHLKFDSRLFTVFFVGGFLLAAAILLAFLALFDNFYLP